jgi:hypothetical protein
MKLEQKIALEKCIHKTWLIAGEPYKITGFSELADKLIVSTDRKMLMYPTSDIATFLNGMLPVETSVEPVKATLVPAIAAQSQSDLSSMRSMMMDQFVNISKNPTEVNLLRAKAMGQVAKSYMDLVKTELSIHKALKS